MLCSGQVSRCCMLFFFLLGGDVRKKVSADKLVTFTHTLMQMFLKADIMDAG